MSRIEANVKSDKMAQTLSGPGIGAMASILNFVSKYFSSLGFNLTVSITNTFASFLFPFFNKHKYCKNIFFIL